MITASQAQAVGELDVTRPGLIGEVLELVEDARRHRRPVAIAGTSPEWPGAVLLDLSALNAIAVNSYIGTVRAQAGATWDEVDGVIRPLGLTIPAAVSPAAGIGGPTLREEGEEPSRPFGPERASLLEAAVVLPGVGLVAANPYQNEELFAAIRDGCDVSGVVVSYLFQARNAHRAGRPEQDIPRPSGR